MNRAEKRLPPPTDPEMRQLDIYVKGERGRLVGRATMSIDRLLDFEAAWQGFHAKHPHFTLEQFVRYVLIKGTIVAVRRVVYNTIPGPETFHDGSG